jgi:hypothetical protein
MPTVWDRAAIIAADSVKPTEESTVVLHAGRRYAELPESGWGALVGWLAGGERLLGCAEEVSDHQTRVTVEDRGSSTTSAHQRLPEEQALVDEDINGYLMEAGAEPRPSGRRWFVLLPDGMSAHQLWAVTNGAAAAAPPHPAALIAPVRQALLSLYSH